MDQINKDMKDAEKNLNDLGKFCGLCSCPFLGTKAELRVPSRATAGQSDEGREQSRREGSSPQLHPAHLSSTQLHLIPPILPQLHPPHPSSTQLPPSSTHLTPAPPGSTGLHPAHPSSTQLPPSSPQLHPAQTERLRRLAVAGGGRSSGKHQAAGVGLHAVERIYRRSSPTPALCSAARTEALPLTESMVPEPDISRQSSDQGTPSTSTHTHTHPVDDGTEGAQQMLPLHPAATLTSLRPDRLRLDLGRIRLSYHYPLRQDIPLRPAGRERQRSPDPIRPASHLPARTALERPHTRALSRPVQDVRTRSDPEDTFLHNSPTTIRCPLGYEHDSSRASLRILRTPSHPQP
ncbi:hypothetical protein CRUP_029083 [Coryphaenoides rupestris]|nr:hypothetical protein CRUP_029083 [Coryphaenoides rupestris]